jgi:peptidoglycan/LPS O-acetylase OafA/YrhL
MALWVFVHHASRTSYGSALRVRGLDVVSATGFLGVGFFFVLSGFILTINRSDELSLRSYAVRRLARIYPLYIVVIAAGVFVDLISGGLFHPGAVLAGVVLLQAWFNSPDVYFVGVVASWSLSVEMFLYVVFPLAARRSRVSTTTRLLRTAAVLLVITVAVTAFVAASHAEAVYWSYIFPLSRVVEFLLGIVVARLYLHGHRLTRGAVLIWAVTVGLVIAASRWPAWLVRSALLTPVWPLLVLSLASSSAGLARLLSSSVMTRLGEASYAFYLVHGLALSVTFTVLDHLGIVQANLTTFESAIVVIVVGAVAVAASLLLLEIVERPSQRWLRRRFDAG